MRFIVLIAALALVGCDLIRFPGIGECEDGLKAQLRSPSTYKRIAARDHFADEDVRSFVIVFDAANGFGTPIRGEAECRFAAKSGIFFGAEIAR